MTTSPKQTAQAIIDEADQDPVALMQGMQVVSNAIMHRQMKANEKRLKGFYVDWLFTRLNITQYR